ncbi:hypothetical protein [Sphingorhabdus sp. Alg231-15]|uniref:hypothetical protein n=1 Tax=Sphingorhabdus sp. Alg231-15 TaxID=1922222 RepID=UPI000D560233
MSETDILEPKKEPSLPESFQSEVTAAGLFGYSIAEGKIRSIIPLPGYVRELEQLPNFAAPSIDRFMAQYVRSTIGVTKSSS